MANLAKKPSANIFHYDSVRAVIGLVTPGLGREVVGKGSINEVASRLGWRGGWVAESLSCPPMTNSAPPDFFLFLSHKMHVKIYILGTEDHRQSSDNQSSDKLLII